MCLVPRRPVAYCSALLGRGDDEPARVPRPKASGRLLLSSIKTRRRRARACASSQGVRPVAYFSAILGRDDDEPARVPRPKASGRLLLSDIRTRRRRARACASSQGVRSPPTLTTGTTRNERPERLGERSKCRRNSPGEFRNLIQ